MHTLYVGYYTSNEILKEIQSKKINNMSIARQRFEENLLPKLAKECNDDISFVSYVPVDKSMNLPEYCEFESIKIRQIGIQRSKISSWLKAMRQFKKYLRSLGDEKLKEMRIIMYEVNPLFLIPIQRLKKKYSIHTATIVAELSKLRRSKAIKYQIRNFIFSQFEKRFDGYILLAEQMSKVLKCSQKPHIVVEGIAPSSFGVPKADKKNIVMYAGGLAKDNNVKLLIDAFKKCKNGDELWICGVGEEQKYVEESAELDPRIRYYGMLDNEEVRELEVQAKFLVNIRDPKAEITKYSFPSKTLEYLASGTAVISSRLEGIQEEYFNYLIPLNEVDLESTVEILERLFIMTDEEYLNVCKLGQEYVEKNKNADKQAKKIISFVAELS